MLIHVEIGLSLRPTTTNPLWVGIKKNINKYQFEPPFLSGTRINQFVEQKALRSQLVSEFERDLPKMLTN